MDGSQFVGPAGPGAGIAALRRRRLWSWRQILALLGAVVVLSGISQYARYY